MKKIVTVRDPLGKPIPGLLIRKLRLKGFEKCNLALVEVGRQTTVTELSTGAQFAWELTVMPNAGEEAIRIAKEKLHRHGIELFQAAVQKTIDRFGEVLNA